MSSSSTSRRCVECGAISRDSASKYCSYCGAELPVVERPRPETPAETNARRFELLREHPDARRSLASRPSGRRAVAKSGGNAAATLVVTGAMVLFAMVFMRMSCAARSHIAPSMRGFEGFPGAGGGEIVTNSISIAHTLIPLAIVAVAIFAAIRVLGSSAEVARSPVRSRLALVVDEHREDRGHGEHRRSVHVATFEDERGGRFSHEVSSGVARSIATGDMGVLHTKGPAIVRFDRVDV